MGTRAIVAVIQQDGSLYGGWQWYDGGDIGQILRRSFTTEDRVYELIKCVTWDTLESKRKGKIDWYVSHKYAIVDFGTYYVTQSQSTNNALQRNSLVDNTSIFSRNNMLYFKNICDAFGQDINYLYVYNPKTGKWKTFGSKYSYKGLVERLQGIATNKVIDYIDTL